MSSARNALRAVFLLAERGSITVSDLARALDIAPSTAHRVLANCCASGFALQHEPGGAYLVGASMHEISLMLDRPRRLRDAGDAELLRLAQVTGETTSMAILEGRNVRFVQSIPGERASSVPARVGHVFPAHCTAVGKAILAQQSPDELKRRYHGTALQRLTDRSITEWDSLMRQLERVQATGWAYNLGETDDAISAIAAPIVLSTGTSTSAVAISTPIWRMQTKSELTTYAEALVSATDTIQRRLRGAATTLQ